MKTAAMKQAKPTEHDYEAVLDYCDTLSAAARAGKNPGEIARLAIAMPLLPRAARTAVMSMGKKRFLEKGYDRTFADAEYGEHWIDEVDDERFALTGMRD